MLAIGPPIFVLQTFGRAQTTMYRPPDSTNSLGCGWRMLNLAAGDTVSLGADFRSVYVTKTLKYGNTAALTAELSVVRKWVVELRQETIVCRSTTVVSRLGSKYVDPTYIETVRKRQNREK